MNYIKYCYSWYTCVDLLFKGGILQVQFWNCLFVEYQGQKFICGRESRWWCGAHGGTRNKGCCGTYKISKIITYQRKGNVKVRFSYINNDLPFLSLSLCLCNTHTHNNMFMKILAEHYYKKCCVQNWSAALKLLRFVSTVTVVFLFIFTSDFIVTGEDQYWMLWVMSY